MIDLIIFLSVMHSFIAVIFFYTLIRDESGDYGSLMTGSRSIWEESRRMRLLYLFVCIFWEISLPIAILVIFFSWIMRGIMRFLFSSHWLRVSWDYLFLPAKKG